MHFDLFHWLLAFLPIIVVLVLMVGLQWGGSRAGPAAWVVTLVVAMAFFGAGPRAILVSQLKGLLLSAYVLYIVWMALLLYNVVSEAGAISVIAKGIARLTSDPIMQLLILGWVFSAFLQGIGGFGVPLAVIAPLLIGLGFDPVTSVIAPAIGHSWSITFGSMASSFVALMAVTGLNGDQLAPWSAAFLGLTCFLCGLAVAHAYEGRRGLAHAVVAVLTIGAFMSTVQYVLAVNGMWIVAGFVSGIVGLGVGAFVARLPLYRGAKSSVAPASLSVAGASGNPTQDDVSISSQGEEQEMGLLLAILPYLALILIVLAPLAYGPLRVFLNRVILSVDFPETRTALGWVTPAGKGRSISIFGHAGAMLAYASAVAYFIYRFRGRYKPGALRKIATRTWRSAVPSSIGIISMVGFAMMMDHAGMTYLLAQGISRAVGPAFPIISPLIGVLGAFMTGSNTNSNVVFAPLQKSTAELLAISTSVILGAQTTGGSLGAMIAPAKVILGCSTAGLAGREGLVMRRTAAYAVAIPLLVGALTWIAIHVLGAH